MALKVSLLLLWLFLLLCDGADGARLNVPHVLLPYRQEVATNYSLELIDASPGACYHWRAMEVSILQKRLEDSCAEAQRWKNDYELLQARVAPFQLQLELYDVERRHLAERNQATESELSKLHHKFSELMGHQNHKQKIHYLTKVTEERQHYQAGVLKLQEQNLKQMKLIQKLELEVKRCSLKPPLASHKENLFP
ncbi:hyaluronan-mediated motility receptor-like [Ixodes scapularis]